MTPQEQKPETQRDSYPTDFHFKTLIFTISLPGEDCQPMQPTGGSNAPSSLGRDTAVLLSDLTQGASNWIQSFLDPTRTSGGARSLSSQQRVAQRDKTPRTVADTSASYCGGTVDYPEGFEPLRSQCPAFVSPTSCPIIRNPFVSPLLAPSELLRGLPPVYIVVREREFQPHNRLFFMAAIST